MEVREISIDKISVSKYNVRRDLEAGNNDSSIEDMANSIREKGLLCPITVRARKGDAGKDTFEIILGQRRFLACKILGWSVIPAIVRNVEDDIDVTVLGLIENVHRSDLGPIDKGNAFRLLYDRYKDVQRVAKETGFSMATIRRYVNIVEYLHPTIQQKVKIEGTKGGHYGVVALEKLATTFPQEKQVEVDKEIGGFDRTIQAELISKSGGDMDYLRELKVEAIEGRLGTDMCKGIGDCIHIPKELISFVIEKVKEFNEMKIRQNQGDKVVTTFH